MKAHVKTNGNGVSFNIEIQVDKYIGKLNVIITCIDSPHLQIDLLFGINIQTKWIESKIEESCKQLAKAYFKQEEILNSLQNNVTYTI